MNSFKNKNKNVNSILNLTGSQCKSARTGIICGNRETVRLPQRFQPCELKKGGFRSGLAQASRGVQGHAPPEKN